MINAAQLARFDRATLIDGVVPIRTAHTTLIAHKSTPVTREELIGIPTPARTDSWIPVPHIELVRGIEHYLHAQGVSITAEKYAVNRDGNALFGVMDLSGLNPVTVDLGGLPIAIQNPGFTGALGLRTSNDKSLAIQLAVGSRVFVCDNLALSGDMIALKRKHTSGLDIWTSLKDAIARFIEKFGTLATKFDALKNQVLYDREAKCKIYDTFASGALATRYFDGVHEAYFGIPNPDNLPFEPQYKGTAWALHNAFTFALRDASLPVQQRATLALGSAFDLN